MSSKSNKNRFQRSYDLETFHLSNRCPCKGERDRVAAASFEFDHERSLLVLQAGRLSNARRSWLLVPAQ